MGQRLMRSGDTERLKFRRRSGWLDDLSVRRAVDDRYRDFLATPA
jgi:hypothetical protein